MGKNKFYHDPDPQETQDWLDYSLACNYIEKEKHIAFIKRNEQIGKMLTKLYQNWKSYE